MTVVSRQLEELVNEVDKEKTEGKQRRIKVATYNIKNGRNGRVESVLRALDQMNLDLALITETKLTDDKYTKLSSGYLVFATTAASPHQGGIALVHRQGENWQVESEKCHGPNTISFELVSGGKRFSCVGTYIPPKDTTTIMHVVQAFERLPNQPRILLGDLNVDLLTQEQQDDRAATIAEAVTELSLSVDYVSHFKQRRQYRDKTTWTMYRSDLGRIVSSRNDYILGSKSWALWNAQIVEPRLFELDHHMVMGYITGDSTRLIQRYLKGRQGSPNRPPDHPMATTAADKIFAKLKDFCTPMSREAYRKESWISKETWKLIDRRAAMHKMGTLTPSERRRLGRAIW